MTYLKPCPFCGEQTDITFDCVELSCPQELGTIVICKQCGAIGAQSAAGNIGAVEYWNTRPIEKLLQKERDYWYEEYAVLRELAAQYCEWEYQNDEGYYETKCGKSFYFDFDGYLDMEDEGKLQDDFKWCPYCGKTIKPIYPSQEEE